MSLLAGACSARGTAENSTSGIAISEVATFQSVEELTEAAELVVVAQAAEVEGQDTIGRLEFVTTRLLVRNVIKGELAEPSITLRQADVEPATQDLPSAVESGSTYLLFLVPFEFERGAPTGDYTLVGSPGQFTQVGDVFEGQLGGHTHDVEVIRVKVNETGAISVVR